MGVFIKDWGISEIGAVSALRETDSHPLTALRSTLDRDANLGELAL
jgi:hypothetical protein